MNNYEMDNDYSKKPSLLRYKVLKNAHPDTLLFFKRTLNEVEYFYAFDESAVMIHEMFGEKHYSSFQITDLKGKPYTRMLVMRISMPSFEWMSKEERMHGLGFYVDEDGALTYQPGNSFQLSMEFSHYLNDFDSFIQKPGGMIPKTTTKKSSPLYTYGSSSRQEKAVQPEDRKREKTDVWIPGLPSSRFNRKRHES